MPIKHNQHQELHKQRIIAAQSANTTPSATKCWISRRNATKSIEEEEEDAAATTTGNDMIRSTNALERVSAFVVRTQTTIGSNRSTEFHCGMHSTHSIMPAPKTILPSTWCLLFMATIQTLVFLAQTPAIYARAASTSTTTEQVQNLSAATALPYVAARQRLTMESNAIHRLIDASGEDHGRSLKRVHLSNRSITCNDGSQAGFYLRKNPKSKKWIVFLEGGWHCYDTRSCRARWLRLRHLMTSAQWPETRDVGGILSALPDENPYWHNANHVLVPYCSSDSWSGTRATPESRDNDWRFMGALILRQVIADLIPLGLDRQASGGAELLLVGSSAGGLGVMLNLDRITKFLVHERNLMVTVRGVSDSGWFLDREPYTPSAVASSDAVRQGWKLWQGLLPEDCVKQHVDEPWRCFFGYRLYPTLKAPLFVFQWLFDEAQMRADNVGAPVTPQQWNYIHEMGGALRSSLDNVTGVFAPSCIGHAVLSRRDWVNIKIDDISLPSALRCWEHATRPHRKHRSEKLKRSTEATTTLLTSPEHRSDVVEQHEQRHRHQRLNKQKQPNQQHQSKHRHAGNGHPQRQRLTPAEREERQRRRHENQQRRRENRRRNQRNRKNKRKNAGSDSNANNASASASVDQLAENNGSAKESNSNSNSNADRKAESNLTSAYPLVEENLRERRRQNRNRNRKNNSNNSNSSNNNNGNNHKNRKRHNNGGHRQQQQQQQQQQQHQQNQQQLKQKHNEGDKNQEAQGVIDTQKKRSSNNSQRRNHVPRVPEKCVLRLLERCSWPQCNHSCPTLTNPLTGEEMRFLELLTSFGLDMEAVAAALGVDMHTLNNMDRTELLKLLTQQVS